jgi:threonine dehydratase
MLSVGGKMETMIDLAAIQRAADRLPDLVRRTPLVASTVLSDLTGAAVCFKAENLQRTGAFKIRGALNKLGELAHSGRLAAQGVTTGSAGKPRAGAGPRRTSSLGALSDLCARWGLDQQS